MRWIDMLPPPLMTSEPGSFAENTIVERKAQILGRVIADTPYPPAIIAALEALKHEILHRQVLPLRESAADVSFWNEHWAIYAGRTWTALPWYFAETYFYRRVLEATQFLQAGPWQSRDPFGPQKRAQETQAVEQLAPVWDDITALERDERFVLLLHSALWGNRADLSNFTVKERAQHGLEAHTERRHLLIDHTTQVHELLKQQLNTVAFINDNVGADSLFDLALADFLLSEGWARQIIFHLKDRPFFVSDAMPQDIRRVLEALTVYPNANIRTLGDRLRRAVREGHLVLRTHPFWTRCLAFHDMPAELQQELADVGLIILKGDVNYRRLLDDRHWPHTVSLARIAPIYLRPYLVLRTLKGEIMVDLQDGQAEQLTREDPTWLINGKRGIIQYVASDAGGSA